ncbi:MAG: hypothetical protein PWQ63_577 [Methanolobus sp.]|nr:hypothetical protein [Methanolobus sp.]
MILTAFVINVLYLNKAGIKTVHTEVLIWLIIEVRKGKVTQVGETLMAKLSESELHVKIMVRFLQPFQVYLELTG